MATTKITKKYILGLLKEYRQKGLTATIAWKGLRTAEQIEADKQALIVDVKKQYNDFMLLHPESTNKLEILDHEIKCGCQTIPYPRKPDENLPIVVRSADFSLGGIWFLTSDIVADSFRDEESCYSFKSLSGNEVLLPK